MRTKSRTGGYIDLRKELLLVAPAVLHLYKEHHPREKKSREVNDAVYDKTVGENKVQFIILIKANSFVLLQSGSIQQG